jgi:UDP-GlcNAc:undecaprenyl-phosphate/decaprenyl-phosphate GlcNAc-1-phosphate transferase
VQNLEGTKRPPAVLLSWPNIGGGLVICAFLTSPFLRSLFFARGRRWVYILLISFAFAYTLTPLIGRFAHLLGVLDYPAQRKIHRQPTPLLGGVAVFLASLVAIVSNEIFFVENTAILLASGFIVLLGMADDVWQLPAWLKLFVQLLATAIVVKGGVILTLFPSSPAGDFFNLFLTFLWVIGVTNAFNFFDGMDGLVAGLGMITAFFLGLVSFTTNQPALGWFAVALLGGCLGFLPYNFRPGRPALIFLGEAGSTSLGFMLSTLAIVGDWSEHSPLISVCSPLLIFAVFIYDMIHITVARIWRGDVRGFLDWIQYTGKDHLHHRLYNLFHNRVASVVFIYGFNIAFGLGALALKGADLPEALLLVTQAAIILFLVGILETQGNTPRAPDSHDDSRQ